jgi:hypothetical protein
MVRTSWSVVVRSYARFPWGARDVVEVRYSPRHGLVPTPPAWTPRLHRQPGTYRAGVSRTAPSCRPDTPQGHANCRTVQDAQSTLPKNEGAAQGPSDETGGDPYIQSRRRSSRSIIGTNPPKPCAGRFVARASSCLRARRRAGSAWRTTNPGDRTSALTGACACLLAMRA